PGALWTRSGSLCSDPRQPVVRLRQLLHRGQIRGRLPYPVEAAHARDLDGVRHEALAVVVLPGLLIESDGALEGSLDRASVPSLSERRVEPGPFVHPAL